MSTEPVQNPAITWTRVWLLYPYVTNQGGFDTLITIANISLDPFGNAPHPGAAHIHFYGDNAPPKPINTGRIEPGTIWANTLGTIAPGFQGYVIAVCHFHPARGLALTSRVGGADASPYVAEVLRVIPPLAPAPEKV